MPHDFLKPILGDELYAQFDEKVKAASGVMLADISGGSYIPKAKYDEVNAKAKDHGATIASLNATITELNEKLAAKEKDAEGHEKQAADVAALQAQIAQLQTDVADRDSKLQAQARTHQIKDALRDMNARNVEVVMPLLKLDAITEMDGKLTGLTEQVDAIRKTDGYLFDAAPGSKGGFSGGQDVSGADENKSINDAIRAMAGRT